MSRNESQPYRVPMVQSDVVVKILTYEKLYRKCDGNENRDDQGDYNSSLNFVQSS